ncbi:dihydrofolate reductase [Candidatus Peregrinibacteria bacterium]|nr:dihydrofolate reductase [Candidatus Peregrinibacteria bacterium]MBT3598352.1 dihydrofolate reductase [Candidatus Peregrinibacteria bacterium]MBT4367723.1 dihydrofolate reductase [Candidatus Peregrinibacteria bacterium]MBT4585700.1 dihydrofolate reductase [Candidatus Peregrinibacteria bacterium]MBT7009672.1 dihydrofolate reductase [Candidatus Peregrinibacteria bacterium]
MKRKIILNLAISIDGFIADEDGGFAWIIGDGDNKTNTENQFDFPEFVDSVDTIVMGKNAYLDCPAESLDVFKDKKIYVASSKELKNTKDNVERINGDICSKILEIREDEGKDIWLWGGAGLTDPFLKEDIVDEFVIGVIPIILGSGRPLFLKDNPTIKLHLDTFSSAEGIVILQYSKR